MLTAVLIATILGTVPAAADKVERPNVILIMTDDQGYGDFGCTGNPVIRTPAIDALYKGSARMPHFYVSPVCTPTRASLMTGRYNYRTRAIDTYLGRAMMEPQETTIAEALRGAGYATGIFGKWHLGDCYPMRAMDQGFEESLIIRGGGIGQPGDPVGGEGKYTDPLLFHNGKVEPRKGYCTDVYFDAAAGWIEECTRQRRPFFAYIPTNAPHDPLNDVPKDLYGEYKEMNLSPAVRAQLGREPDGKQLDNLARIFAMITNIDQNVGRLLARLDALDIAKNTIVIFLTDNGPASARYVGPFRSTKGDVHEGGVRTLFTVRWPARLEPGDSSDRVAAHIDVMPTLLEACGVPVPAGLKLDGRSILPLLERRKVDWPDRTIFIQTHRGNVPVRYHHFMARSQEWKLLNASGFSRETPPGPPEFELYRVAGDPAEAKNLAAEHPEIVERMKKAYDAWFDDVGSTRPDNYAPPRIQIGRPEAPTVTLTRQDWRVEPGCRSWEGCNGSWLLHIASGGPYHVQVRVKPQPGDATVRLRIGSVERTSTIPSNSSTCTLRDVELPAGDTSLQVEIVRGDQVTWAWQVDVEPSNQ